MGKSDLKIRVKIQGHPSTSLHLTGASLQASHLRASITWQDGIGNLDDSLEPTGTPKHC